MAKTTFPFNALGTLLLFKGIPRAWKGKRIRGKNTVIALFKEMTSKMKVKKRVSYPPDLEETPLVNVFNLRNSKLLEFG